MPRKSKSDIKWRTINGARIGFKPNGEVIAPAFYKKYRKGRK